MKYRPTRTSAVHGCATADDFAACFTNCWKIAADWHTPTVGIESMAPPPSHSAVQYTNHCATAPFPKRMVWTQLILCTVYRDTVLSPDVTTVTAQHSILFGVISLCSICVLLLRRQRSIAEVHRLTSESQEAHTSPHRRYLNMLKGQ